MSVTPVQFTEAVALNVTAELAGKLVATLALQVMVQSPIVTVPVRTHVAPPIVAVMVQVQVPAAV